MIATTLTLSALLALGYALPFTNTTTHTKRYSYISGLQNNCNHDIAITFDDGPYQWENDLSNIFADNGQRATFFVNGYNWGCIYDEANVQRLRHTYEAGHQIGSHTWSHVGLSTMSTAQIDEQIQFVEDALWKILGVVPAVLRPPYGDAPDWAVQYINDRWGYTVVNWSEDSGDSAGASAADSLALYQRIAGDSSPHLTLNHETYYSTVFNVMPGAVSTLVGAGRSLTTVATCKDTDAYKVVGSYGQRDSTWTCEGKPAPGVA